MKYVVIGAGGTGGFIGAYLAKAGKDVTFIARGEHLAKIKSEGLKVESVNIGNITLHVQACTMEDYQETPDVVFVCVKYYGLDACIDFINRVADENTLVIPILNVFGTGGEIAKKCSGPTVLDGCIYIFGMIKEPGVISQPTSIFRVFFGYRNGQSHTLFDKVKTVENDLCAVGIDAKYTENIMKEALQKFSFVSPMGAAGLYYNAVGGDFMVEGEKQDTFFALVKEIERLANAMDITFDVDLVETNRTILLGLTKDSQTSMQRDVYAGKNSEIDGLVHRVVRLAKEHGLPLPTYEKISAWAYEQGIK